MTELQGKKRKRPSSCPEDWLPAAMVVQLELTRRQERYAQRCVGIARFVYNRMLANDQAGRDAGLWLTPHELEKEFNAVKYVNPSLAFVTEVSKFVAQGACRNYRNARSRWLNKELKARRRRVIPGRIRCEAHPLRRPPADPVALHRQRQDDPRVTGRNAIRDHHQEAQRPLVGQHRLLEAACAATPARNPIGGRR